MQVAPSTQLNTWLHAQLSVFSVHPLECMLSTEPLFLQNSLGPQSLSTLPSSPVSGFGTAKRPSMATKSGVPGPGAYKLKNTVGMLLLRNACSSHALYRAATLWFSVWVWYACSSLQCKL